MTIALSSGPCGYAISTDGGFSWTYYEKTGLSGTLTETTITLPAGVNAFRIGRNLQDNSSVDHGTTSGTFYLSSACFTYANACTETEVVLATGNTSYTQDYSDPFTEPTFALQNTSDHSALAGTFTYRSSNEDIATVAADGTVSFEGKAGTVVITVAYEGGEINSTEYCASSTSYTIVVTCGEDAPKIYAAAGTNLSGCNTSITLVAKDQSGNDFATGTYQWYRDGEAIDGAISASYTAERAGVYTVERAGTCVQPSTNSANITNSIAEPQVSHLAPFQYYHVDKTYTDQMKMRHLFLVHSYGAYEGKHYYLTATRNGSALDISSYTAFTAFPSSDNSHDTVMVDLNQLSGKFAEGDEIVITCAAISNCNTVSSITDDIIIHVINQTPTLALIVSGAGDAVGGDFLTGYKERDLQEQTGAKSWSGEWPLYTYLKSRYNVTPVNGFATFNKFNYEPFDIALLTDFPKASVGTAAKQVLDNMSELCDFRPLLSFKTHMVQDGYPKWRTKGFITNPVVPKTSQLRVDIVCYAHPMFAGLSKDGDDININVDDEAQTVFTLLNGKGYESNKGIQGFEVSDADNFVIIAYSHNDATPNDLTGGDAGKVQWVDNGNDRYLVAMCERQTNVEARMILFSLNAGAHSKLTNVGMGVVDSCLQYLLDVDPLHVSDCSLTFDNNEGNGDGNWSTASNWLPNRNEIPHAHAAAQVIAPCRVDITNAVALSIRLDENGSLSIPAGKALKVTNSVKRKDGGNFIPTSVEDIFIGSDATGNGTLICNNNNGDTRARVAMYSKAQTVSGVKHYQYIGVPHNDIGNALYNYYGAWLYYWNGAKWKKVANGGAVSPWTGYCINQEDYGHVYIMDGTLEATTDQEIAVGADEFMVIGNSWTAPLSINNFRDDDFDNLYKTIFFFNTGVDPEGDNTLVNNPTGDARWTPSTYTSVPIHSAPYTGDSLISSMQGFFVQSTASAGSLTLRYDALVRNSRSHVSGPMHVKSRYPASDKPAVLSITASGTNYDHRLVVLEREDFSRGYDDGWDGEWVDSNPDALAMWTTNSEGKEESVTATPEMEGTIVGFRANNEDDEYTLYFNYSDYDEPLYLLDNETKTYTRIQTGGAYHFTTYDKGKHNRFLLTRNNGNQTATGWTDVVTEGDGMNIVNTAGEDLQICMYDASGKLCYMMQTNEPLAQLQLPATQGVYMIHVNGATTHIVRKVVR